MVRLAVGTLLTLALVAPAAPIQEPHDPARVAVVVNDDVPGDSLTAATVRRIFLRRQRFWRDGTLVAPVNLPATSRVRDAFSRAVLGRAPRDMAEFWNDAYFHGIQPPPVLDSQRAVLLYVARTPGAVGYVAADSLPAPDRRSGYRLMLVVHR
jgi:ABC-type phosphate transport system substrate-binding protein